MQISPMTEGDTDAAVSLIANAMNEDEARWAKETIDFHFFCARNGKDDGHRYFVGRKGDAVIGMTGLHTYSWGPPDVTWLGWFAVAPSLHGAGIGRRLIQHTIDDARTNGYRALFVETYSDDTFAQARSFYEHMGFTKVGGVQGYITPTIDMVVYRFNLMSSE